MLETSARLLKVLSMLHSRPTWQGGELAERLGISTRTVRADVERLRRLGYDISSRPGATGGYRLHKGSTLPLLLDEEEATAVALGLRTAANGAITGIEDAALRALAKLLQEMRPALRHRINTLLTATSTPSLPDFGTTTDAAVLAELASAIHGRVHLRFDYTDHSGRHSHRNVEPERLVHRWGRWYLLAFDLDRMDRRTFRADRVGSHLSIGPQFNDRPGAAEYLQHALSRGTWEHDVRIRVDCPASVARGRLPPGTVVNDVSADQCIVELGVNSAIAIGVYLCLLDADFEVIDDAGLAEHLNLIAQRFSRAAGLDAQKRLIDGA